MRVEVVYAIPGGADSVELELEEGTTAEEALRRSGMLERHPEISLRGLSLGVFGRRVKTGDLLSDGDRLEIYRPLATDPKEIRRLRAKRRGRDAGK